MRTFLSFPNVHLGNIAFFATAKQKHQINLPEDFIEPQDTKYHTGSSAPGLCSCYWSPRSEWGVVSGDVV